MFDGPGRPSYLYISGGGIRVPRIAVKKKLFKHISCPDQMRDVTPGSLQHYGSRFRVGCWTGWEGHKDGEGIASCQSEPSLQHIGQDPLP